MKNTELFEQIKTRLPDYLPKSLRDTEMTVEESKRPDGSIIPTLRVMLPGSNVFPAIHLDKYVEEYEAGRSLDDMLLEIAEFLSRFKAPRLELADAILEYDNVRPLLRTKLSDQEVSSEYLNDKVWTPFSSFALQYRISVDLGIPGQVTAVPVTQEIFKQWGVSLEQLHADATEAEAAVTPAYMVNSFDLMLGGRDLTRHRNLIDPAQPIPTNNLSLFVLSNSDGFNGAAVIAWPGVLERVAEVLQSSFWVTPSSIHEVVIYPDLGHLRLDDLQRDLYEANRNSAVVPAEDVLSDKMHYYDRKKKALEYRHI